MSLQWDSLLGKESQAINNLQKIFVFYLSALEKLIIHQLPNVTALWYN